MDFDVELFERLQAEGLSAHEIGNRMRCSYRTVQRWRRRLGAVPVLNSPHSSRPISAERLERARALLEGGASRNETSRTLGINRQTLRRYFPELKWSQGDNRGYGVMMRQLNRLPVAGAIRTSTEARRAA